MNNKEMVNTFWNGNVVGTVRPFNEELIPTKETLSNRLVEVVKEPESEDCESLTCTSNKALQEFIYNECKKIENMNNSNIKVNTSSGQIFLGDVLVAGPANPDHKLVINAEPKEGLRFNQGKTRYDLMEPFALEQLAKVFTKGAEKYAAHNWEKGMDWSKITASLKRHIAKFEQGEDFDEETGLYHMAHAAWNAMALISYYKLCPSKDDRQHSYLNIPRIGLDIDEVLCDFTAGWAEVYDDVSPRPTSWYYDRNMSARFKRMGEVEGGLENFYMGLKPKVDPMSIPFEPVAYVTSRPVDSRVSEAWLDKHGFPRAKVITVGVGQSKVDALRQANVEVFIDDSFNNFAEINKAGILCYLWDAPHNERFDVGFKRINSFKQAIK
jgi:hypothetical protein